MNLPVFLKVNQYFVLYTYPKPPYIDSQNRLMVPARIFCQRLLGADVNFDYQNMAVTVKFSGKSLKFTIGSRTIEIDGKPKEIDTVPVLSDGKAFIPLRTLTDAFGIKTEWNDRYRYIHLQDDRIMKTQTILEMEDITAKGVITDSDAFIPVSASLSLKQKAGGFTAVELFTESRNISGQDIQEGREDIQIYIAYNTGWSYDDPYRERPTVKVDCIIKKRMTGEYMPGDKLNYILYWGRVIDFK
ncbi:copper amine oxidase N-terminal domain-containing protein [Thermoanaerobacterium sp. DL9XJH110]|uniref:copper amine oxidase N-terminal domain-containing protein n=1 Tax=Thermoanaerobacterium sp. DL9XJH110 TaxID=3386643 RepID=UPI003BB4EEA3